MEMKYTWINYTSYIKSLQSFLIVFRKISKLETHEIFIYYIYFPII